MRLAHRTSLLVLVALAWSARAAAQSLDVAPPAQNPPPVQMPVVAPQKPAVRAPRMSLWTGGRVGMLGYGYSFFDNVNKQPEYTGNFVGTGGSGEIDVGVRFAKHYVPYLCFEIGLHPAGHRFEGQNAHGTSVFAGGGFRYLGGNVDSVAFLADLAFGLRWVTVSNTTDSFTMSSVELFRLGLGAEFRLTPTLAISPLLTLSGGAMSHASGSIKYTFPQGDKLEGPQYHDADIDQQRGYLVISIGIGAHFDLFARY